VETAGPGSLSAREWRPLKEHDMVEVSRGEIVDIVTETALKNSDYRTALLKNPKKVLEAQLGRELPDWLNVQAVEETADTMYVVVPHVVQEGAELADADLEQIAGGGSKATGDGESGDNTYSCNNANGVATRVEINADFSMF
jgi:predicted house-cleaning noncanonical NTP pyrophosphatase (MazG superfamily)